MMRSIQGSQAPSSHKQKPRSKKKHNKLKELKPKAQQAPPRAGGSHHSSNSVVPISSGRHSYLGNSDDGPVYPINTGSGPTYTGRPSKTPSVGSFTSHTNSKASHLPWSRNDPSDYGPAPEFSQFSPTGKYIDPLVQHRANIKNSKLKERMPVISNLFMEVEIKTPMTPTRSTYELVLHNSQAWTGLIHKFSTWTPRLVL